MCILPEVQWSVVSDWWPAGACSPHHGPPATSHDLLEEAKLLEAATHDGLGVQTQPLVDQRGISATEIVVIVQVAIEQFLRRQRWYSP